MGFIPVLQPCCLPGKPRIHINHFSFLGFFEASLFREQAYHGDDNGDVNGAGLSLT